MQRRLGLVSAILPHLVGWQEVADYIEGKGLTYVEVMCWPNSDDKRAFAGVTHVDPYDQDDLDAMAAHLRAHNVDFSLGYYPNVMDPATQHVTVPHLMQVIRAATSIGAPVNTFAGGDPRCSLDDQWDRLLWVWNPIRRLVDEIGADVRWENCRMYFKTEGPYGVNTASTPYNLRRLFGEFGAERYGLCLDPAHPITQDIDLDSFDEFGPVIRYTHAKDWMVDRRLVNEHGILVPPCTIGAARLPGYGDVDLTAFIGLLDRHSAASAVSIEVEDGDYAKDPDDPDYAETVDTAVSLSIKEVREAGDFLLQPGF